VWAYLLDDFGTRMTAVSGASWVIAANVAAKSGWEMQSNGATAGDWAQYVYVGYGFQLYARTGPAMGKANLYLEGAQIATIDFYSAAAGLSSRLLNWPNVPLGEHYVQRVATNTKNVASTGTAIVWDALRVMR
jgi:hypothetical protein